MKPFTKTAVEWFGWYGAFAILLAYVLVSFSLMTPKNPWFQMLNLTGALGIVTVSYAKKAYQPALLNVVWALVALAALTRLVF